MNQKTHKYTSGKLEERKPQKIHDSSYNDRAGARKCSIKKIYENFCKSHRKIPVPDSLSQCKVSGLLRYGYFPVNFAKLLRTTFSEHPRRLLLSDVAREEEQNTTQFKNESKTKQNTNSKLNIHNIHGRKNMKVICKDLVF